MRGREHLYLGTGELAALNHFLIGYALACREQSEEDPAEWLYRDFRAFLAEKYHDNRSLNWESLIRMHEPDGDTTAPFWRLLDAFLGSA